MCDAAIGAMRSVMPVKHSVERPAATLVKRSFCRMCQLICTKAEGRQLVRLDTEANIAPVQSDIIMQFAFGNGGRQHNRRAALHHCHSNPTITLASPPTYCGRTPFHFSMYC